MPRRKTDDDDTPRRRRGAGASAAAPGRGLLMRIVLHSPKDLFAALIAFSAASAIIANAMFLQSGRHPAPMFGGAVAPPSGLMLANPLPRPRPADADGVPLIETKRPDASLFDPKPVEPPPAPKQAEPKSVEPKQAEPRLVVRPGESRSNDAMANLVRTATPTSPPSVSGAPRPPASIPVTGSLGGSRRVAAVQRVLTEYGYAQLRPSGVLGADTKAAIENFERERKLPVDGQVTERLVRELYAATGHAVE